MQNMIKQCANYNDEDPITLEPIRNIPLYKVFFITCPITKKFYAHDALAWATYFVSNNVKTRNHPCTRVPLSSEEVWECFFTAKPFMNATLLNKFKSVNLQYKNTNEKNTVEITPVSPLFYLSIQEHSVKKIDDQTKQHTLVYSLCDSRNVQKLIIPSHRQIFVLHTDICLVLS